MKVFFERREELAPGGIWQYWFRPERSVDFVPGQYVHLQLPVEDDPRGKSRTLTITSLPTDPLVGFVLKHFELQSPYKQVLQKLELGAEAGIDDAMGDLVLPKNPETPLVFVAGGIGIASFAGMFQELLARKEEREIFFFYALRSRREQIFRELTDAYPLALKQIVFFPNRLSAQEIKDSTPPDALVYLSGSQPFVEGLHTNLITLGTPREQIAFDYYDGYSEL